jgi:chromosome segregation ATPase
MHKVVVELDEDTFERAQDEARHEGLDLKEWIQGHLRARLSPEKEVRFGEEPVLHAERIGGAGSRTPEFECQVERRELAELAAERERLKEAILSRDRTIAGLHPELVRLDSEISRGEVELDWMERDLERIRLDWESIRNNQAATGLLPRLEQEIERKTEEIDNFTGQLRLLMDKRDQTYAEIARSEKTGL